MVNLLSRGGLPTLYNGNEILMQGGPKIKQMQMLEKHFDEKIQQIMFISLKKEIQEK
ncbi:hypothetical protein [Mycoplasmopsis cynos]|uniref:hypothetical protein n=1 Tax=Mycoplasmopsis cynos TaxID=171284 RepID=UPI002206A643|nr:hypothetical protein [Mycoplasmopsis cynos]UWV81097.1 hypothetical protein NW065_03760 [Mycoplasmopsis cynos]